MFSGQFVTSSGKKVSLFLELLLRRHFTIILEYDTMLKIAVTNSLKIIAEKCFILLLCFIAACYCAQFHRVLSTLWFLSCCKKYCRHIICQTCTVLLFSQSATPFFLTPQKCRRKWRKHFVSHHSAKSHDTYGQFPPLSSSRLTGQHAYFSTLFWPRRAKTTPFRMTHETI